MIIRNVSCATNQHIRMISEGSCDTEDWRNDAENSAQVTCIHYRIYSNCLLLNRKINTYIFYIMFYYIYI